MNADIKAATPKTTMPEAELVAAAKCGKEWAVRELIRRQNPRLFKIAKGIVNSDAEAEDVVQESYLIAFTQLDKFRSDAKFSTWITRITINAARMKVRAARPHEEFDTVVEANNLINEIATPTSQYPEQPETAYGRAQIRNMLESAVEQLPSDLRLLFIMREVENMSILAIANDLSINPVTVKTRLFRARRHLRATLENNIKEGFGAIFPFDGEKCGNMADRVVAELKQRKLL